MTEQLFKKNFFDTGHLKTDLKGRSVRGGAVTLGAQGARFSLQMASTVVLARLLTPQDFGLIAMVMVITGFVLMFKDMGLSAATVQKAEVNHDQISTLFWINVAISFVIMLIIVVLAPTITWFYGEPKLTLITIALACGVIFGGLTVQHQALLRRQMRFGTLAIIDIVSMAVGVLSGIIAACYGLRYWALVIIQLIQSITSFLVVWSLCEWRPGWPVRHSGVREMLVFGGHLTGFNFLNYFARNIDNLLIGKFWGSGQLGLYSKAYNLLMLPIHQITLPVAAVAVPALSRLQDDPERYRRYYYRAISMIAFVTMPSVLAAAALSAEIVDIVLGNQWGSSAAIFKVLAFASIFQPIGSTVSWVYISLGQGKRMMYWGLIMAPVLVLSFIAGLHWGALGVAVSYTLCYLCFILFPTFWFAFRYSPVTVAGSFEAVKCPLVLGVTVYLSMELMRHYMNIHSSILAIVCCLSLGISVFVLGLALWPRARNEALDAWRTTQFLRKPNTI